MIRSHHLPAGVAAALLGGLCLPAAHADVTLTHDTANNVYVLENDMLTVTINESNGRVPSIIKKTGPDSGKNQTITSFASFLDRVNQESPTGLVFTMNGDGDDSAAKRSLKVTETITTKDGIVFNVTKTIRLRDHDKALEGDFTFQNTSAQDWVTSNGSDGAQSIYYIVPGGATPGDDTVQVKTVNGLQQVTASTYWGNQGGTGVQPELAEGWLVGVDSSAGSTLSAVTWDLATQRQFSRGGVSTVRSFRGANRFQIEVDYTSIPAGATLNYKQYWIVDDGIPLVSHAAYNAFIGGVTVDSTGYQQGDTLQATLYMNSTKLSAASYDLRNVRFEDADGNTRQALPDITNLALAAGAHIKQTLNVPVPSDLAVSGYSLMADVYPAGGGAPITTLISKSFAVASATAKVIAIQDPGSGNWLLQNEVLSLTISPNGSVISYKLRDADNRDQTVPTYAVFLDHTHPFANADFAGFTAVVNPYGTNSDTKKSLGFTGGFSSDGSLNKVYTLESMSRSLQADLDYTQDVDNLVGEGYFSQVAAAPGGGGDEADRFTAKTADGLAAPNGAGGHFWFGVQPPSPADGTVKLATRFGPLVEPWMATTDTTVKDALAVSWDMAKQQQYSLTPTDGSAPVTMNQVYDAAGHSRHVMEAHFTNIPQGETLHTTMYSMGAPGFGSVSYAEGMRVMAGAWTDRGLAAAGDAFTGAIGISNVGVTNRTFSLKNIRLVGPGGVSTSLGADVSGIATTPAQHVDTPVSGTIPAGAAGGAYSVQADLFENGMPVTTLISLPINVVVAAPVTLTQDGLSNNWVLENEVVRVGIAPNGEVTDYQLKTAGNRDQVDPSYHLFRDYTKPAGSLAGFSTSGDGAIPNPNGTDSATRKSLTIGGLNNANGTVDRTFTLESMSRSLAAGIVYTNKTGAADPILGGGYFPQTSFRAGGTTGASDQFTAKSADNLLAPHDAGKNYWFGAIDTKEGGVVAGDMPELTEPWMAQTDATLTDAVALSWSLADQKAHSLTPPDASEPVTSNNVYVSGGYGRAATQVHFTNIVSAEPLDTTMYIFGDTGFQSISYAEGMRVMAGIWAGGDTPAGGSLSVTAGLTNVGTTSRTFAIKDIRLVNASGVSIAAGADQTNIALTAAQHADRTVTFAVPAAQAPGTYTLRAELYEGAAKVSTLISLPFNITPPVTGGTGDVDNSGTVTDADVVMALKIAGGLLPADAGQALRGDMDGDGALTALDAVLITRKITR